MTIPTQFQSLTAHGIMIVAAVAHLRRLRTVRSQIAAAHPTIFHRALSHTQPSRRHAAVVARRASANTAQQQTAPVTRTQATRLRHRLLMESPPSPSAAIVPAYTRMRERRSSVVVGLMVASVVDFRGFAKPMVSLRFPCPALVVSMSNFISTFSVCIALPPPLPPSLPPFLPRSLACAKSFLSDPESNQATDTSMLA